MEPRQAMYLYVDARYSSNHPTEITLSWIGLSVGDELGRPKRWIHREGNKGGLRRFYCLGSD